MPETRGARSGSRPGIPSLRDLRGRLPALVAEARQRATEFEAARALAPDYVGRLRGAGLFRLLVPQEVGGLGASLPQWLEIMVALAEADASSAWVSAHASVCAALIYGSADRRFCREFFADPDACAAWSNLPRVHAHAEADGLRIRGSWGFESGCTAATFVGGVVALPSADGCAPPRLLAALAPVGEARIEPVWDPIGLAGTGSHDVHFDDVLVPWHRTFEWPYGKPAADFPAAAFVGGVWFISICAAATHLGLARRALDESRAGLAGKSDRATRQPLLEHPSLQRGLEAAEGLWFACRAGLREALAAVWASAATGETLSADLRLQARVAAVTAVQQCAQVVRDAYDLLGASAVHRSGVLQRLLREGSCLTHHVSVNLASYEATGRVRCGIDPLHPRV